MTFTTTQLNGNTEQVIVSLTSQKDGIINGLKSKKGFKPFVVVFGSDSIYRGFGYTVESAIENAKKI